MSTEPVGNELSPAELKYFETGGAEDIPAETPEVKEPAKEAPDAKADAPKEKPAEEVATEAERAKAAKDDGREESPFKHVPLGVLRAEREQRQEWQRRAKELEQQLLESRKPPVEAKEQTPIDVLNQVAEKQRQFESAINEQQAKQQFLGRYQASVTEFAKDNADFGDAYRHALNIRRQMWVHAGVEDQTEINALLENEEAAIVDRAFRQGKNPAQVIYDISKTYGYAKKAAPSEINDAARQAIAAEKEAAAADTSKQTLQAAQKLEKIAKGMENAKNLSGPAGGSDEPSLEELLKMPQDEFEKATAGKKFAKLMGG